MKIAHVISSLPYGGMQRLAAQIAEEQCRRGHDAHVIAIYESQSFIDDLNRRGIPYSMIPGRRPSASGMITLFKALRSVAPDIAHVHGGLLWSNATALLCKREPWIQHVHCYPETVGGPKGTALRFVDARLPDAYIGISKSVASSVRARFGAVDRPIYIIHNGITVPGKPLTEPPHSPDAPVFGMATRLAEDKGAWEFVAVAAQIRQINPRARFVLVGDGPLLQPLREYIQSEGWQSSFSLPGHMVEIDRFWRTLNVAVFTAPQEPLGLRILEPMAAGVPVAAFRTGYGSDELIDDEITGVQAEWGDTKGLARRSVDLAADVSFWKRISAAAFARIQERFSLTEMCDRIENVYERHLHPAAAILLPSPR